MSTAVASPTLDVSGVRPIPQNRLVKVELRKMGDTRAGLWLLIAIGAISAIVMLAVLIWGHSADKTYLDFLSYAGIPENVLLPVLGILLVTQEWGQRTALVTFTQVPKRSRILIAKFEAAIVFGLAALLVAAVVAVPLALVGGADKPWDEVSVGLSVRIVIGFLISIIWGLAFGGAFLNSAFAIVLYYLVPTIISIVGGIWTSAHDKLLWIDLNTSQGRLFDTEHISGKEWGQLGTGLLLFVVIPGAIGVWRLLRSEVK
jgi:ABC-2 type transport system permease protein